LTRFVPIPRFNSFNDGTAGVSFRFLSLAFTGSAIMLVGAKRMKTPSEQPGSAAAALLALASAGACGRPSLLAFLKRIYHLSLTTMATPGSI
jgi:hypothetical protein